jgi:transketolase
MPDTTDLDQLAIPGFGMSAPIAVVAEHFGFTADRIVEAAKKTMAAA